MCCCTPGSMASTRPRNKRQHKAAAVAPASLRDRVQHVRRLQHSGMCCCAHRRVPLCSPQWRRVSRPAGTQTRLWSPPRAPLAIAGLQTSHGPAGRRCEERVAPIGLVRLQRVATIVAVYQAPNVARVTQGSTSRAQNCDRTCFQLSSGRMARGARACAPHLHERPSASPKEEVVVRVRLQPVTVGPPAHQRRLQQEAVSRGHR